jgi:hypothetical protein
MRSNNKTLGLRYFFQRGPGTAVVAFSAFLAACSSLIGIEDLNEGPRPGDEEGGSSGTSSGKGGSNGGSAGSTGGNAGNASGSGGDSGKGGSSGGSAGASASGGTAGSDGGTGGTTGGSGGDGGDNMGGDTGTGGTAGTSGEAGTGGTTPMDMTVRGKLIDFYRHPLPGVTVAVGESEVVTNAQGEFVAEDVPATYDVSFVVQWSSLRSEEYGWVYQGLTRRDPTLQVYQGLDERSMNTNLRAEGGAPTDTQNLSLAVGSEHGTWEIRGIPAAGRDSASYYWMGPTTTAATAHGLMWSYDDTTDLPTDYVSYDTFPIALDDTAATQTINIDVTEETITQGNISGTITNPTAAGPINSAFLRFTSGATIRLFEHDPGPATFSYLVPQIPNASVTFLAMDENWQTSEFALAHQAGIAPGTTNIALEIPATSSLTAPAQGAMVTNETSFRYQNRQTGVGAVVVRFIDVDYYQGLYVVTASTNFTLPPVLGGGFTLRPGGEHSWVVQTHGPYADVDAMTGANGFMDPFSMDYGETPQGPNTSSGTFTQTAGRFFTVAQ